MVQRPPPGSSPSAVTGPTNNNNAASSNRRGSEGPRNSPFFRAIDGMVLGAMAIPMNTNSGVSNVIFQARFISFNKQIHISSYFSDNTVDYTFNESIINFMHESDYCCSTYAELC